MSMCSYATPEAMQAALQQVVSIRSQHTLARALVQIDKNVEREILVHSQLEHPLIVGFKRVFLTPTHLGIALQYAEGATVPGSAHRRVHLPLAVAGLLSCYVDFTPAGQLAQAGAQHAGGELFDRVRAAGHFTEDEARYFFQQLICGVDYCHRKHVTHRDLKLVQSRIMFASLPCLRVRLA